MLAVAFTEKVVGRETDFLLGVSEVTDANRAIAIAGAMIAIVGIWSAYVLWAFSVRRVSWLSLRGSQFVLPLMALLAWLIVDLVAGYVTTDPLITALGGTSEELHLGYAPGVLWFVVALTSVVAAVATPYAAGLCRHLKTGVAPNRMRRRHIGVVPRPLGDRSPAKSYRLIAADDDVGVADEIRRALADSGMSELGDGDEADRQIVVVSDRTPADWLSLDNLRSPLAVVATSVALPIRGVLQQAQWVDYRRRRRRTLARSVESSRRAMRATRNGRCSISPSVYNSSGYRPGWQQLSMCSSRWRRWPRSSPHIPSSNRRSRIEAATSGRPCCAPPSRSGWSCSRSWCGGAGQLRRRLLAAVTLSWLGMAACGLNWVVKAAFANGRGTSIPPSVYYPLMSAVVFGLAWPSLRRWLPTRVPSATPAQSTLGSASGSWPWRVAVVPLSMGLLTAANVTRPIDTSLPGVPASLAAADDVCRDRADIYALLAPLGSVNQAVNLATSDTIRSAARTTQFR